MPRNPSGYKGARRTLNKRHGSKLTNETSSFPPFSRDSVNSALCSRRNPASMKLFRRALFPLYFPRRCKAYIRRKPGPVLSRSVLSFPFRSVLPFSSLSFSFSLCLYFSLFGALSRQFDRRRIPERPLLYARYR